jgi:hypothetical protein
MAQHSVSDGWLVGYKVLSGAATIHDWGGTEPAILRVMLQEAFIPTSGSYTN